MLPITNFLTKLINRTAKKGPNISAWHVVGFLDERLNADYMRAVYDPEGLVAFWGTPNVQRRVNNPNK